MQNCRERPLVDEQLAFNHFCTINIFESMFVTLSLGIEHKFLFLCCRPKRTPVEQPGVSKGLFSKYCCLHLVWKWVTMGQWEEPTPARRDMAEVTVPTVVAQWSEIQSM